MATATPADRRTETGADGGGESARRPPLVGVFERPLGVGERESRQFDVSRRSARASGGAPTPPVGAETGR